MKKITLIRTLHAFYNVVFEAKDNYSITPFYVEENPIKAMKYFFKSYNSMILE